MKRSHRAQPLWFAFVLHRLSGVLLGLFLPVHFYVLSQALTNPQRLDSFLSWTDNPLVKAAEFLLVFLLAVHLFGGLRLMALEFLPWSDRQKTFVSISLALAFLTGCVFLMSAA